MTSYVPLIELSLPQWCTEVVCVLETQCSDNFDYAINFLPGTSLSLYPNISRWFDFCSSKEPIQTVNKKMNTEVSNGLLFRGPRRGWFSLSPLVIYINLCIPAWPACNNCLFTCRVQRWNKLTLVSFLSCPGRRWGRWSWGSLQRHQGEWKEEAARYYRLSICHARISFWQ